MNKLFNNAIQSIQLGVEDYQANDPKRAMSAVRNFYSGILLLGKEVLSRKAPKADLKDILGAQYKPVPDGNGGIEFRPRGKRTIDFSELAERFKDFGIDIDQSALIDLNQIRNDVEHLYTNVGPETVREAIGKAFPVAVDLFRAIGEDPHSLLGESWQTMLEVRGLYERELAECRATFEGIEWNSPSMAAAPPCCPKCESYLIERTKPKISMESHPEARCRACGETIADDALIEGTLRKFFEEQSYAATADGDVQPLHRCPDCSVEAYVTWEEENGCVNCGLELSRCLRCEIYLDPNNVSWDNNNLCSYCDHILSKDD